VSRQGTVGQGTCEQKICSKCSNPRRHVHEPHRNLPGRHVFDNFEWSYSS